MGEPKSLDDRVDGLRSSVRDMDQRLARLESQIGALIRATLMREPAPDPITDIDRRRFAYSSQHDEDGMLYALFGYVGTTNRRFVEIGCGANGGNSGFLARECGWSGLMVDGSARNVQKTLDVCDPRRVRGGVAMVGGANVRPLFEQFDVPREPDLVSVDIDSIDYWVIEALTETYRPRVLVTEYNSVYGSAASVTVPNIDGFVRPPKGSEHLYYGASLTALTRLAARRGYRLICGDATGTNAVFVRNDVAPAIPGVEPSAVFRYYLGHRTLAHKAGDVVAFFRSKGLTLVDV